MTKKDLNAIYIIAYILDEHFNITVNALVGRIEHIACYVGCTVDDVVKAFYHQDVTCNEHGLEYAIKVVREYVADKAAKNTC